MLTSVVRLRSGQHVSLPTAVNLTKQRSHTFSRSAADALPYSRLQTFLLVGFAVIAYLLLCNLLFREIRWWNAGTFTYALDDPYIHLALSEGIAAGHYGINPGEPASPSSSVLWPLLLAPFARFSWQVYVPLALNLFAGVITAALIGLVVARWPQPPVVEGATDSDPQGRVEAIRRVLSVLALLFIGNLCGLTFVGMEHTLQVLLAGAGAWGILACLRGKPMPWWVLAAVALGPLVRYEALGISLAVAVALVGQQRQRAAAALLAASALPLLLFSLFLHHLGLPWVPTSVLVKSRMTGTHGLPQRGALLVYDNLYDTFSDPHRTLLTILFVTLAFLAWKEQERVRRFALAGAAAAGGLHLLIGRFHWFYRYEVYIAFFSALVVLQVVQERPRGLLGWYVLGLFACAALYLQAFREVPLSANQVFRQQYQMHRFVTDFYEGNIAVNDLGLVSYRHDPRMYVLDLWGLASVEAARQRDRSTAWMGATVHAHHVGVVMIYPHWFRPPPAAWTPLGELCLDEPVIALGGDCVDYYATPEVSLETVQDNFNDFVATLPVGMTVRRPAGPGLWLAPAHPDVSRPK